MVPVYLSTCYRAFLQQWRQGVPPLLHSRTCLLPRKAVRHARTKVPVGMVKRRSSFCPWVYGATSLVSCHWTPSILNRIGEMLGRRSAARQLLGSQGSLFGESTYASSTKVRLACWLWRSVISLWTIDSPCDCRNYHDKNSKRCDNGQGTGRRSSSVLWSLWRWRFAFQPILLANTCVSVVQRN